MDHLNPVNVADFVAAYARELAQLAEKAHLETLVYILRMAEEEARAILMADKAQDKAA